MIEPNAHYEPYESHGGEPGEDEQDWLHAEQVLFGHSATLAASMSSFEPLNRNSL
jgi:hypothetical protein